MESTVIFLLNRLHQFLCSVGFCLCFPLALLAQVDEGREPVFRTDSVFFEINKSYLDTAYCDNGRRLVALVSSLRQYFPDTLYIDAAASPDGVSASNEKLAQRRAAALATYLRRCFPHRSFVVQPRVYVWNWHDVAEKIVSDTLMAQYPEILRIMNSAGWNEKEKQQNLKRLKPDEVYRKLAQHYLPAMRYAVCRVVQPVADATADTMDTSAVSQLPDAPVTADTAAVEDVPHFAICEEEPDIARWRLTTNLLYWAILAHNVGVEYDFNRQHTLSLSGACAWWSKLRSEKVYRWMAAELAYHWYLKPYERHRGFFAGAYVQTGLFEFMFSPRNRKGEFVGGGLCAGYRWLFRERLSLTAEAGIGYSYTDYRHARYIDGTLIRQGHNYRHYVGPSRVALTFSIDLKKKER